MRGGFPTGGTSRVRDGPPEDGGDFDPEAFSLELVNRRLARLARKPRRKSAAKKQRREESVPPGLSQVLAELRTGLQVPPDRAARAEQVAAGLTDTPLARSVARDVQVLLTRLAAEATRETDPEALRALEARLAAHLADRFRAAPGQSFAALEELIFQIVSGLAAGAVRFHASGGPGASPEDPEEPEAGPG